MNKFALLAATLCSIGCGAAADGDDPYGLGDELGVSHETLNGTVTFTDTSCNNVGGVDYRPVIRQAATLARNFLGSSNMLPCLSQHFLSATNGTSAETIWRRMQDNMPTRVRCARLDPAFGGQADHLDPTQPEGFRFNTLGLPNATAEGLALTFLHEVAHNKGYAHPEAEDESSEHDLTVTNQVAACARGILGSFPGVGGPPPVPFANGPRQDELVRATFLSPIGGTGSGRASRGCYSGGFARGLFGKSGSRINAVGVLCTDREGRGRESSTLMGNDTGTSFTLDCGPGKVMVGLTGRADNVVSSMTPLCSSVDLVRAGTLSAGPGGGTAGTAIGDQYLRLCPAGKAVRSAFTRLGANVGQLTLQCEDIDEGYNQTQTVLSAVGATLGTAYRERCPVGSIMTGLFGGDNESWITRLGGLCREVQDDGESISLRSSTNIPIKCDRFGVCRGRTPNIPVQAQGGFVGRSWGRDEESCRPGLGLVGMLVTGGEGNITTRVRRIRGICANATGWSSATGVMQLEDLPDHGGSDGGNRVQALMCPRRQFITGWEIRADNDGIWQLQPICTQSHESGAGHTCQSRCDINCTQNMQVVPQDPEGVAACINACRQSCGG